MTQKYSPAQLTYLKAKAAYQTACEAMDAEMKPFEPLLDTEEGIEEYSHIEEKAALRLSRYEFAGLLREAEQALIDWTYTVVSKLPQYQAQAAELEKLRMTKNIKIRARLVDAALRLRA